jgi:predicted DNA-binding transcriptional regulator AlpA
MDVVDDDMMDCKATCAFFGGNKPIHAATLYRGIKQGRIPKPLHPAPGISRWSRAECKAARQEMMDKR